MSSNNRSIALAAVVLAGLLTPRAEATLMKAASFDEKVTNSAAIVLGRVVKKESRWNANHRFILTYTTFKIEKAYKGLPAQQEITVVTPGGSVGDVNQDSAGVPDFAQGSDNIVFIRNSSEGPTVLYFEQGVYDVAASGNDRVITPMQSEAVHIDTQRGMAVTAEEPRTIAQFEGAVRDSERRVALNRMELIKRQQQQAEQQSSAGSVLARYKWWIAAAVAGAALATWQLTRR